MGGLTDIVVPSESFENTRSRLVRWLKATGDAVTAGEPLVEVETDKVTVEIAAPASGVLVETLKAVDAELEVGDLIGRIGSTGSESLPAAPPAPAGKREPRPEAPAPLVAAAVVGDGAGALSPAVRRLLAQHHLDPTSVRGSGGGGRITVDDILRHLESRPATPPPVAAAADGIRRVPHSPTRRRIAERMVESLLRTAPHVTTLFEADLTAVLAHREHHRSALAADGIPLTLSAYFAAACVPAIRAVPEANSRWTADAIELVETIDIGIATAVEGRGLFVPVIRDVAALDLRSIAAALQDLTTRARADKLTPADVRGGSFTISNHGVSGSLLAAPIIINQPQSAILGIGRVEKRAVVIERGGADAVVIRPRCYVTLTLDHRVMDGHQANRFLAAWVAAIEGWNG